MLLGLVQVGQANSLLPEGSIQLFGDVQGATTAVIDSAAAVATQAATGLNLLVTLGTDALEFWASFMVLIGVRGAKAS